MVEVVIAAMIAAGILSGLALAVGAAGKLQGVSKVKARMANVAESVLEEVQNNRTWMDGCEKQLNRKKNLAGMIQPDILEDAENQTTYDLVVEATARDFDTDGVAGKDVDGTTCDGFDMLVKVSLPTADAPRLGAMPPVEIRTVVDTSGTIAKGALLVEACAAMNQVDDRLAIGGCAAGPGIGEARGNFTLMPGCQNAANCPEYDAVRHKPGHRRNESPYIATERIDVGITVTGPFGALTNPTKLAKGLWLYTDVPAGEYTINALAAATTPSSMGTPRKMQRWYTQEVPSRGRPGVPTKVAVEYGARSSALIAYKPKPPGGANVRIDLRRLVGWVKWSYTSHTRMQDWQVPWDTNCEERTDIIGDNGLPVWWCENRKPGASFHYVAPLPGSIRTEWAKGTRTSVIFQVSPQPYNRAVTEVAKDKFETVQTNVQTTSQGDEAGVGNKPPINGEDHVDLSGFSESGLNTAVRHSGGGTLTAVSAGSGSLLQRTWIDPVNGYMNGSQNHRLLYQESGECYITMDIASKGGMSSSGPGYWQTSTSMSGGHGGGVIGSGWFVSADDVYYEDHETDACAALNPGTCGSVWWKPTGQTLLSACTLLLEACDVTQYEMRSYPTGTSTTPGTAGYWLYDMPTFGEYDLQTSTDPSTNPYATNIRLVAGTPATTESTGGPDITGAYTVIHGGMVMECEGYNPPKSCNAAGEACGVMVYIPPTHEGSSYTYPTAEIAPSLTA